MMETKSRYETDYYSWTQEQAALLKSGQLQNLDMLHLIEEVEDMASNKRSALKSHLKVLLTHLLKWHYQPDRRGRSWTLTITEQRLESNDILEENPGLKPELPGLIMKSYRLAKLQAERETGLDKNVFPEFCPWTFEQIINDDFFPD